MKASKHFAKRQSCTWTKYEQLLYALKFQREKILTSIREMSEMWDKNWMTLWTIADNKMTNSELEDIRQNYAWNIEVSRAGISDWNIPNLVKTVLSYHSERVFSDLASYVFTKKSTKLAEVSVDSCVLNRLSEATQSNLSQWTSQMKGSCLDSMLRLTSCLVLTR